MDPSIAAPARHVARPASWVARVRRFAADPDPLVEAGNWVALTIGSHLPFWPLYVLWCAGRQAWPSSLLTVCLAPGFLLIPILARRHPLAGRAATPLLGLANTLVTTWILGAASGSELFLAPCAMLAALLFRRHERWMMLALTLLPAAVWYGLRGHSPPGLQPLDAAANAALLVLNGLSVGVLAALFGWLQLGIYQRLERA